MAHHYKYAGVAELADAPDLGSGALRRGGSTPFTRTIYYHLNKRVINNIMNVIVALLQRGRGGMADALG